VTRDMTIACFAEHRGDVWEGLCLDFDIAVQGDSLAEVQCLLHDAVADYVEFASEQPLAERNKLLRRRAPGRIWLKIALLMLWSTFQEWRGRRSGERSKFHLHCAA